VRATLAANKRPRHWPPDDLDTSSTAASAPHPRSTDDHATCAKTTTTQAAAPRARRTRGRPTTARRAPRPQRHERQRCVRAEPAADRRPRHLPSDDNDTSSSALCAPHPRPTDAHANCDKTSTTRAAAPPACRNCGRPTTKRLAPRPQRHAQLSRVHAAPKTDRRQRHLPHDDNDTSTAAACATHPRGTDDHATCPLTTTTRAPAPPARRTRGRPTTTPLASKRQKHEHPRRVRAAPAADRRPRHLPPDDNDTSSTAACAPHPRPTNDFATCTTTTTTRVLDCDARRRLHWRFAVGRWSVTLLVPHMVHLHDVVVLHTFVLGDLGALLLACFGFDLRFALVVSDLGSDSIWSEGVGVGVGARGGSTWAGGDYLRGALGCERRANLRTTNKARSHTHKQAQATQPLHRGPPTPIPTAFKQVHGPRAGAVTRARCASWCRGGCGKCEEDEVKVVQGRDGQGARLGKVGRVDKKTSWTEALPAWAASISTS